MHRPGIEHVAGEHSTTEPPMVMRNGHIWNLAKYPFLFNQEKQTTYALRAVGPRQRGASCTSTTKINWCMIQLEDIRTFSNFSMDCIEKQRVCIEFCFKLRKTDSESFQMLKQALKEDALSQSRTFE
ncbi:hypothetical protein LAZ67_7002775 [Cordylochernes scorpioides]|uniref:Uncharacterized protein n=1 Tax=Cordylochernes scorpioides TaxID=51811 RepID=A0ABY6KNF4_9ARAC|nr:hypothetical protein LAZ67_7002775 [Cordylochernes scorpioides]